MTPMMRPVSHDSRRTYGRLCDLSDAEIHAEFVRRGMDPWSAMQRTERVIHIDDSAGDVVLSLYPERRHVEWRGHARRVGLRTIGILMALSSRPNGATIAYIAKVAWSDVQDAAEYSDDLYWTIKSSLSYVRTQFPGMVLTASRGVYRLDPDAPWRERTRR